MLVFKTVLNVGIIFRCFFRKKYFFLLFLLLCLNLGRKRITQKLIHETISSFENEIRKKMLIVNCPNVKKR